MRIALVADLHGNYVATQALEKELNRLRTDEIWFLGDAVGKGPQNAETCDWVRRNCTICVGGNWDWGISRKEYPADHYFWNQLGPERMSWLSQLPGEQEALVSGIRFRLIHGRPVTPLYAVQDPKEKLGAAFTTEKGTFGGVICADSHRPFFRTLREGYIVNTGSVGNGLGVARAHAVLLDGEKDAAAVTPMLFSVLSVPYDNHAAAEVARLDTGLPHREEFIKELLTGEYAR